VQLTLSKCKEQLTELAFHPALIPLRRVRKSLANAYPSLLLKLNHRKRAALAAEFQGAGGVEQCIEFTRRHMSAGSCQIPWEIESAMARIAQASPRIMGEIGTSFGGTSLLFTRFLPTLEKLFCIDLYVKNKEILRLLAPLKLELRFFDMPSYAEDSVERVRKFLGGRMIDVLFIDGDHRYEGVRQDFISYRDFVRDGGLILFHDIVEDRGGGRAWAGGVPRLWKELAPLYPHGEFVHSHDQEGFGIGVLTYSRR